MNDIPIDSEAGIGAENVLGAKFINIRKGRSPTAIQPGGTPCSRRQRLQRCH
jgi:ABC-type transporter Mla subunit MlaD